jgi:branched-chain amino acid transport system substrate-binding protein
MSIVGAHPMKGQDDLVNRFKQRTGEPFMQQDSISGYYHVWTFKEALELAKSADPKEVNKAMKKLDLTSGTAAASMAGGRVRFDEKGRRIDAIPIIGQWQDGVPYSVYPSDAAMREARFQPCQ